MTDFRPPAPTYRQQANRVWEWWKSLCGKPQLWGVYAVFFGFMIAFPTGGMFPAGAARLHGIVGVIVSTLIVLHNWQRVRSRSPTAHDRGQLTIPDVVFFGAGLLIVAGLAAPIYELLNQQAGELGTGAAYLLQMVVPGLLITMLIIFFAIASGGGQ